MNNNAFASANAFFFRGPLIIRRGIRREIRFPVRHSEKAVVGCATRQVRLMLLFVQRLFYCCPTRM